MNRLEKSSQDRSKKNERGQATTEFVLLMIIVVAVILGAVYQLNDAFKNYLDQYFGNYLVCLIETGELPTIGGGGGESQCTKNAFSLSSGSPAAGEAIDGEGSGGDGAGSGGDGDATSRANRRRRSVGRGNAEASGRGGGNGFGRVKSQTISTGASGSSSEESSDTDVYTGSTAASSSSGRIARIQPKKGGRMSSFGYVDEYGDDDDDDKKKTKEKKVRNKAAERERSERARKISFTPPPPIPKRGPADDNSAFQFSKYIKWLIILAIIVAIVVFVGGQAMNITKSWEK